MILVPGYTIKREIGTGGMATVYLAVQTSLDREVALKVMNPALVSDPNFSRRFLQEARTLASLSHPNIVAVYDVGVTETQLHYFSMQHLSGGDFASRIREGVKEAESARVLGGVARALGFAHARGFVHRDVSPANVLFDTAENPILTDFGIAHAVTRTSRLSNAGVSVGTSHYMSPEQARGGEVDARSDIYSLGCVAYEALAGKPPYDGEDGFAIAYAHVFEPIPRLPVSLGRWQDLVDRSLAKDPRERFADLDAFIASLNRATEGLSGVVMPKRPVTGEAPKLDPIMLPPSGSAPPATAKVTVPAIDASAVTAERRAPPPSPRSAAATSSSGSRRGLVAAAALAVLAGLGILGWVAYDRLVRSAPPAPAEAGVQPVAPTERTPPPVETVVPPPVDEGLAGVDTSGIDGALPVDDGTLGSGDAPLDGAVEPGLPLTETPLTPDEIAAQQAARAVTVVDPIGVLLALARYDLSAQRLTTPPGQNALERFRLAQRLAEHHRGPRDTERARQGVAAVATAYVDLAEKRLRENKPDEFLAQLARAEEIGATVPEGKAALDRAKARRAGLRDEALAKARAAALAWKGAEAKAAYERALRFDPASAEAKKGAAEALRIGTPGWVFRDSAKGFQGPELVVVNAGGKRIAAARTETTVGDFSRYWSARGRSARGGDRPSCKDRERLFGGMRKYDFASPGFAQDSTHPVVCVGWADASDYAQWLSGETGKRYRLPTSAEWAALAAGAAGACRANVADASYNSVNRDRDSHPCDDGYPHTAPVRRFDAAASGVYDIGGNAREWVADGQGSKRSTLGSAWHSGRDKPDTGQRTNFDADATANTVGFRLVRDID